MLRCSLLFVVGCCALLACGGRSSDAEVGNPSAGASTGGINDGAASGSGEFSNGGGNHGGASYSGGPGLPSGGTAGSLGNTGGQALNGGAADSGAFSGPVDLCLYPEDMPDNWGAAGGPDASGNTCALGKLGPFVFDGCRYQLLEVTAHDVDPFSPGHSHCCYPSQLLGCP